MFWVDSPKRRAGKRVIRYNKAFCHGVIWDRSERAKTKTTTRSQEATKNVTTNVVGVAQTTNPLITVATYVALFLAVLPIGILGAVQIIPAQANTANKAVLAAEEDATTELTAAERRAQRKAAREAREETKTAVAEPEVAVEVVNPGFNGFDMQNADFGTMPTPFAGGFGMMPMPPFGGFPGFGAMPTTDAEGFNGFGAMPNADENPFNGYVAGFGNF